MFIEVTEYAMKDGKPYYDQSRDAAATLIYTLPLRSWPMLTPGAPEGDAPEASTASTWAIRGNVIVPVPGVVLGGVHDPAACGDRPCVVHRPSDHHLRSWVLHWRDDRGMFERLCPEHGIGHPDPDQVAHWQATLDPDEAAAQAIHGCCGDCREQP